MLAQLLGLSLVSTLGVVAPEAIAIPYAGDARMGGLLMAAPIAGAALGVVLVGRWQPEVANSRIIVMALLMPAPLFLSAFHPSVAVTWGLWFVSGALQAFMLPLQSTFSLLAPKSTRCSLSSRSLRCAISLAREESCSCCVLIKALIASGSR